MPLLTFSVIPHEIKENLARSGIVLLDWHSIIFITYKPVTEKCVVAHLFFVFLRFVFRQLSKILEPQKHHFSPPECNRMFYSMSNSSGVNKE